MGCRLIPERPAVPGFLVTVLNSLMEMIGTVLQQEGQCG